MVLIFILGYDLIEWLMERLIIEEAGELVAKFFFFIYIFLFLKEKSKYKNLISSEALFVVALASVSPK